MSEIKNELIVRIACANLTVSKHRGPYDESVGKMAVRDTDWVQSAELILVADMGYWELSIAPDHMMGSDIVSFCVDMLNRFITEDVWIVYSYGLTIEHTKPRWSYHQSYVSHSRAQKEASVLSKTSRVVGIRKFNHLDGDYDFKEAKSIREMWVEGVQIIPPDEKKGQ